VQQLETRLTPSLSALASFSGSNGAGPTDPVIMDSSGNLYGTTTGGGAYGDGTVFELANGSGKITTLASFNGTNGSDPVAALIMDSSGNLYSTTATGGAHGDGTVFELAHGSGTITTLASFNGTNGNLVRAPLVMDGNGNLYGTTERGGSPGGGTVFELAQGSGTITTLASFSGSGAGQAPLSGLLIDSSGNLYGTTFGGGDTIFEVAHGSHTITVLASLSSAGDPYYAPLVMDSSGNLYGTAEGGGDSVDGAVFELAQGSSTVITLASFNGTNGDGPTGLIMDSSGNLYGTTQGGGASNDGTVFEVAQGSGTITALASFNGSNGADSQAGLIMDGSSNLYGTTQGGGASHDGTVFELSSGPSFDVSGFPATAIAGQSASITVTALNASGSINTSYSGTVQFTSSDPHAVLPSPTTLTNGTGTFNVTLVTAGTQSITATDTSNSGITGAEGGITITAGAATQFVISGPTSVASGTSFSITVTAEDAYGNIATGYTGTVHFSDSASGATLPANYTFTSGDMGVHTFSKLKLKTKGWETITVADTLNNTIQGTWLIDVT